MSLLIILGGSIILVVAGISFIGLLGSERDTKNIGYRKNMKS